LTAPSGSDVPGTLASASQGFRFEAVAAAVNQAPSSVAWASAPVVSGSTAPSASLSVFSQSGPLVLDRWSESPFARLSFPAFIDPQRDGYAATTPGLDGDDSVLVGGSGNDLVIGGGGRNLMVGGFGFDQVAQDRAADSADALTISGEPGASATGGSTLADRNGTVPADTAAAVAPETAGRDEALWSALTGRAGEAFNDAVEAVALDQFFGSAGIDLAEMLGERDG
jgi:hypothetical protein